MKGLSRRNVVLAFFMIMVLSSCEGAAVPTGSVAPEDGGAATSTPRPADDAIVLDCEREGYPCSRDEVDPAVIERESQYVAQLRPLLTSDTFSDALDWIRAQDGVVMAEANETTLVFRLDGGRPLFVIRPERDRDASAEADGSAPMARLAGVVGRDTHRANRANRKKALFLEPWQSHGLRFTDEIAWLRGIKDYDHADGIDILADEEVTPPDFTHSMWNQYDAIFVKSHGGSLEGQTWVSTGTRAELGNLDFATLCDSLFSPRPDGVDCGLVRESELDAQGNYVRNPDGSWKLIDWVAVGLAVDYFREEFGNRGGLDKAFVYIGACDTLTVTVRGPELADAIAGKSSVFVGWRGQPSDITEGRTARRLLQHLIQGRLPAEAAHSATCTNRGCNQTKETGDEVTLGIHGSEAAGKLRLYDVPTLRDPKQPASVLQDGAHLEIIGTPGDGQHDKLEITVELAGIVDPRVADDSSPGPSSPDPRGPEAGGGPDLVGRSLAIVASGGLAQATDPASMYNLRFFAGGRDIGADNLGEHHPAATVTRLNETTYRYTYVAQLPFDVDPEGTDTTLRIEVDLPEVGVSDHEVDVTLVGSEGSSFRALFGGALEAEILAQTTGLAEPDDLLIHGEAEAILTRDGSSLIGLDFEGPLQGLKLSMFATPCYEQFGEVGPIPLLSTGTFYATGSGAVWDIQYNILDEIDPSLLEGDPLLAYIAGPAWWDPEWAPLELSIAEFTDDVVVGTITGEIRDVETLEPSRLRLEFRARTTVGSRTDCGSL